MENGLKLFRIQHAKPVQRSFNASSQSRSPVSHGRTSERASPENAEYCINPLGFLSVVKDGGTISRDIFCTDLPRLSTCVVLHLESLGFPLIWSILLAKHSIPPHDMLMLFICLQPLDKDFGSRLLPTGF